MRFLFCRIFSFCALFATLYQKCGADVIVQDQNWPVNSSGVWQFVSGTVGEIADVTTTGRLVDVVVPMNVSYLGSNHSDILTWYILNVSNGLPVTTLATGTIPSSAIGPTATLDLSNANLNFVNGDQFAFAFHGDTAQYSWYSYYGANAPFHRSIVGTGSSWAIEPDFYNPTYIGAYSSYFDVVPEPSTLILLTTGALGLLWAKRRSGPTPSTLRHPAGHRGRRQDGLI